jgi:hypothetical protein
LLLDPASPEAAACGLHGPSLVSCVNVYTIDQGSVKQVIGILPPVLMEQVDDCLRQAFNL